MNFRANIKTCQYAIKELLRPNLVNKLTCQKWLDNTILILVAFHFCIWGKCTAIYIVHCVLIHLDRPRIKANTCKQPENSCETESKTTKLCTKPQKKSRRWRQTLPHVAALSMADQDIVCGLKDHENSSKTRCDVNMWKGNTRNTTLNTERSPVNFTSRHFTNIVPRWFAHYSNYLLQVPFSNLYWLHTSRIS